MIRTIIWHDVASGKARVRFEHNGVTNEQDYDLIYVIPGTSYIFEQMGLEFTEANQMTVLDKLQATIQNQIELGMIVNPPPPESTDEPMPAPPPVVAQPIVEQPVPPPPVVQPDADASVAPADDQVPE